MPTPHSPAPLSQLPASAVHQRFSTRPALYSVVFNALRSRILACYPSLPLDLPTLKLAIPQPEGHYIYRSLMEVALAHVLDPQLLDLHTRRELPYYLTQQIPTVLKPTPPALIDMQVIAHIIDQLRVSLPLHFQQELADYWSASDSHGRSRWQWLSEFLNGQMTAAAAGQSSLTDNQRAMLTAVAAWPGRLDRLSHASPTTYAYFIESTLVKGAEETRLLSPDLLLVRDQQVLLYSIAGRVEAFTSIDDFSHAWGARMQRQFEFDSLTWRRNEPDGNVFEQQAGLLLDQALEDLAALTFEGQDETTLQRRLDTLTDPAVFFTQVATPAAPHLQTIRDQLPEWLTQASADDRFALHRHQQEMAQVLRRNQGQSFNDGIENIHDFSRAALRKQMRADHGDYDPDEVLLDFTVAAGYPGGAGIVEHVRLSLTELAVKNLAGKPSGRLTLSAKGGLALPGWLDEDYLMGSSGLIQRVDIGSTYPQRIRDVLLSDTRDARRREQLFTRELKVKLPMQALEYKIRQQHGLTVMGYRYVKALMGSMPSDRYVDGEEILLRPLAFCRKTGAQPDEVSNAFIIEPRDVRVGPHLLYQPLYADCLHEYPTRQALLDALAKPGELQNTVLTWLTDQARPIYANGGIKEPHIIRFLAGDEFSPPQHPAPATLAVDEGAGEWLQSQVNGQLLNHLYGSTARALVDLADSESVSNSESRWAVVMEGAWLLFNTLLLPLVQGPAMLAGWFMVLVASLEQDLAGLDSSDPTARELALIDLLLNTAMVLLHAATPANRPRQPLLEPSAEDPARRLARWRRPAGLPHAPSAAVVHQGAVALPGEPPATGHTALDFTRSLASPWASARLMQALLDLHVPWPASLPPAQASGPLKGLYRIDGAWHASVGALLFQVNVVQGFNEVYLVHPQHPQRPGFKLTSDQQGRWGLDRRARLEGGMPRERLAGLAERNKQRLQALNPALENLTREAQQLASQAQQFNSAVITARVRLTEQQRALKEDWERLNNPQLLPALRSRIVERHEQRQRSTLRALHDWNIAVENYRENTRTFVDVLQQSEATARQLMELDRTEVKYKDARDNATTNLFQHSLVSYANLHQKISHTLQTRRGEDLAELLRRVDRELPDNITDAYEVFISGAMQRLETLKEILELTENIEATLQQATSALRANLLAELPPDRIISSAIIKHHLLLALFELLPDRTPGPRKPEESPFLAILIDRQATVGIFAHTEMRTTTGYSPAEQMAVLKDSLKRYEQLENAVISLSEMHSSLLRDEYRGQFLEQLGEARASLEAQLASLILVEEKITPRPAPDRAKRPKKPTRRVIKTVDKTSLIGDLRPSSADASGNFVDINDTFTGTLLATYHEHPDEGVWKVVEPADTTTQLPPRAIRPLKTLRTLAQTLTADRAGIDASIRFQQRKLQEPGRIEAVDPYEWEVMLTQHAAKFEALAAEIDRDHATDSSATALRNHVLEEAASATQKAREVCSEGYKLQRPKAANIAYLWKYGFVDINLVRSRIKLKAGDYLTEYAIRDKSLIKAGKKADETVLWYAHFHYPSEHAPASQPAFGHLKTRAERLFTRRELIEQSRANNRAVVNLDKAEIKPPLDQTLFLGLEVLKPE
ncbi:hypothetical protein PSH70_11405 [Pseudomonas fluorescens]|uniref:hypothetical protein n=1 Tax=Pseudomonas fluorescens TaxID=294 RepID=UPI0027399D84|nr:hypothetical protein [Pseudomonas fluorescens]WLH76045.1 hypothetical protein PSH70_11405 [Pseudomonas fluorescens]